MRRLLPTLAGVHVVEAGKSLYGAPPVAVAVRQLKRAVQDAPA